MHQLKVISEICDELNVTSRTLRYYEDIGLITSIRKGDGNYRYYDESMIKRIEQILMMRRLSLSVKEIEKIMSTKDIDCIIDIFVRKLKTLKDELMEKASTIKNIEDMLDVFRENRLKYHKKHLLFNDLIIDDSKDELEMGDILDNSDLLSEWNIRILKLYPMTVAYYVSYGKEPEMNAWKTLYQWIKENNLDEISTTRYFGFNNPDPTKDSDTYGYEVWATVHNQVKASGNIKIKDVSGGLYAVKTTNVIDIVSSWQKLYQIILQSKKYEIGKRWLEEHLILGDASWKNNFQVDLYCPLKLKEKKI